jgi:polyferredoxin
MDKMNYPRGLVRYATLNGLAHHWSRAQMLRHVLRPRVLVYTGILCVIVGAVLASLWLRSPFKVDVVRDRASLARIVDDGWIENVYRVQVMNATERPQRYRLAAGGIEGAQVEPGGDFSVAPAEARWVPVSVRVPPQSAERQGAGAHALQLRVERLPLEPADDPVTLTEKTTFMIPR